MEPCILERAHHPISRRDIHPNVLKVLYRLIHSGHLAYLVGGGVRDLMLGRHPKDFDVATSAHPQQVRELFGNSRLIGRRFRLIHVFFGRQNIEVATFRRRAEDVASQSEVLIHHDNTFGTAEEDAFRRDFTVNALFYDPRSFHVIDYVGGVEDLSARLIRTIGDPELRMREDPVRMLRAVRFAAKLDFDIEETTRRAIRQHHGEIVKASPPRLVEEIYRTLSLRAADRALALMEQLGLLGVLLPELSAHLRASDLPLEESRTLRNLKTLGRAIDAGAPPSHALILAGMLLDLYRNDGAGVRRDRGADLREELRRRGFARGDTDQMRLLLEAFDLLIAPSRRTWRLSRRPYFAEARHFYGLLAPNYGGDPAQLERFLAAPLPHHLHPRDARGVAASSRRRRKRRRGGRRHRASRMRSHSPAIDPHRDARDS